MRLVQSLGSYTTKAFRNFEYNRFVSRVQEPKPLWEDCVDTVNNTLRFTNNISLKSLKESAKFSRYTLKIFAKATVCKYFCFVFFFFF